MWAPLKEIAQAQSKYVSQLQFQAIAACTKTGKPTGEQLRANGMLNG